MYQTDAVSELAPLPLPQSLGEWITRSLPLSRDRPDCLRSTEGIARMTSAFHDLLYGSLAYALCGPVVDALVSAHRKVRSCQSLEDLDSPRRQVLTAPLPGGPGKRRRGDRFVLTHTVVACELPSKDS